MLVIKEHHCAVKFPDRSWVMFFLRTAFTGQIAFIVQNFGFWVVIDFPASLFGAVTPVDVFAVHVECFIKQAYLVYNFASDQLKCANAAVYFVSLIFRQKLQVVFIEKFTLWKEF